MRNKLNAKVVRIVLGVLFLVIALGLTLNDIIKSDITLPVISHNSSLQKLGLKPLPLLKDQPIQFSFVAEENNLGLVFIRLTNFNRLNQDHVRMSIKEEGEEKWFQENTIDTLQINPDLLYPFGFPIISDSKGKKYQIEIVSKEGTGGNSVGISKIDPVVSEKYFLDIIGSKRNPKKALSFIIKKGLAAVENYDLWFTGLVYLLPFIALFSSSTLVVCLTISLILLDVFLIHNMYDTAFIILISVWFYVNMKKKSNFFPHFFFAYGMFSIAMLSAIFNTIFIGEKSAVYALLFLASGIIAEMTLHKVKNL